MQDKVAETTEELTVELEGYKKGQALCDQGWGEKDFQKTKIIPG